MKSVEQWKNSNIWIGGAPGNTEYHGVRWSTKGYRTGIKRLLKQISSRTSGSILLSSIAKRVLIVPVCEGTPEGDNALMGVATSLSNIDMVEQSGNADNVVYLQYMNNLSSAWRRASGTAATGSEMIVQFTPAFYGSSKQLAQSFAADYEPDAMLFHELVHASRGSRGVFDSTAFRRGSALQPFDNHEEYFATLLTNIYRSQQYPKKPLRASHATTFQNLIQPQNFHLHQVNQRMLGLLSQQSPNLVRRFIFEVQGTFNPIRDHANHRAMEKMKRAP